MRHQPDLAQETALWQRGYARVAGVDEAGRGALAGPVVAAALIFPAFVDLTALIGIHDSKALRAAQRAALLPRLHSLALDYGVGSASAQEIDALGILPATRLAMRRALQALRTPADFVLLDYVPPPAVSDLPQQTFIKGDQRVYSIAAASILAKTQRDAWMIAAARQYPQYGFERHKGYGTARHRAALREFGGCELHRKSFAWGSGEPISAVDTTF